MQIVFRCCFAINQLGAAPSFVSVSVSGDKDDVDDDADDDDGDLVVTSRPPRTAADMALPFASHVCLAAPCVPLYANSHFEQFSSRSRDMTPHA